MIELKFSNVIFEKDEEKKMSPMTVLKQRRMFVTGAGAWLQTAISLRC